MLNLVKRLTTAGITLALLVGLGAGCAQDVGDIDRTQPDKIKKSLFKDNDEWYFAQTVTDTDFQNSGPVMIAQESGLKRIRWEITEDTLYAYSTTSLADGINADQKVQDKKKLGAVAAFPIKMHFDVQRQYNTSTGEPTNVIVENASDRPWYEREYMRVDWSTNLVDGFRNFGSMMGTFSSLSHDVPQQEESIHPDRTRIGKDYIDVTVRYAFSPDIMACGNNLGMDAVWYCNAGKVSIRNSFLRITEEMKNDYEPKVFNDTRELRDKNNEPIMSQNVYERGQNYLMEVECNETTADYLQLEYGDTMEGCQPATFDYFGRFGYFRTRRVDYDKDRPFVDQARKYYANRWDVWDKIDGKVKPKPIVYHLNAQYPKDMIDAAKEVERQWDKTFKKAIKLKAGAEKYDYADNLEKELKSIGKRLADNPDVEGAGDLGPGHIEAYQNGKMFYIRKNNCMPEPLAEWKNNHGSSKSADRKNVGTLFDEALSEASGKNLEEQLWSLPYDRRVQLCADLEWATEKRGNQKARFTYQRRGDLRYSFFNWTHQENGYWSGYGPSSADPKTGEIISGDANYAGTALRETAQYGADLIQYMNGDLDKQQIRFGTHIDEYVDKVKNQRKQGLRPGELPAEAERELERRAGRNPRKVSPNNFNEELPEDLSVLPTKLKKLGPRGFKRKFNQLSRTISNAKKADTTFAEFYENPKVKKALMKDAQFQMLVNTIAAQKYGADAGDSAKHQAYLDVVTPRMMYREQRQSQKWMAEQNMFSRRNLRRAIEGLVTYRGVAEAFEDMTHDEIADYIEKNAFIGTQLHEVGHTVGLRHNFNASMDALNWHDSYWKIQKEALTNNNVVKDPEDPKKAEGKQTVYHLNGKLAKKVTGRDDVNYANEEEFQQASVMDYTADLTGRFAGLGKYDQAAINFAYADHVQVWKDFDKPNRLSFDKFLSDYSRLPELYGDAESGDKTPMKQKKLKGIDIIMNGREWIPVDKAIERRKEGIRKNTKLTKKWWEGKGVEAGDTPYTQETIPFNFCSDYKRDYVLGCSAFDHGGNFSENVNHSFNSYNFFQPFWRYKGADIDWGFPYGYMLMSNYAMRVQRTLYAAERPFRFFSIYEWLGYDLRDRSEDLKAASIASLNFYAKVMAMPEPGRYCKYDPTTYDGQEEWQYNLQNSYVPAWRHNRTGKCSNYVDIPKGPGQFYSHELTPEYNYRVERVGTYIDKILASQSFFYISGNFINNSFITDSRATNITFYSLFKDEMLDWLGSMIIGDFTGFAGTYDKVDRQYKAPKVVDPKTFGTGASTQLSQNAPRIKTNFGYGEQLQTLAGAMLVNTSWQDYSVDFRQYIKVINHEQDKQPFGKDTDVKTFTHPITNVVYSAPQTSDGKSIAVDLIEWANNLRSNWEYAKCLEQNFDSSQNSEEYLKKACGDRELPVNYKPSDPEETRSNISELETIRLRQVEQAVAKLNMIRDINELTDLE